MIQPEVVQEFLAQHRIAIVGASDEKDNFGRAIHKEMRDRGYDAVAVHPTATVVNDEPCFPDLASVPGALDGIILAVPATAAADVVRAAIARQVPRVWFFKGAGAGSVSAEAIELAHGAGVTTIDGACPLMFLEPTPWFHRAHRMLRRLNGSIARAA